MQARSLYSSLVIPTHIVSQTYVYYQHYPRDRPVLKGLVGTIWWALPRTRSPSLHLTSSLRILDTLHTILVTHMVYTYLVTNFGDYTALAGNIWSFNVSRSKSPYDPNLIGSYRSYMSW